MKRLLIAVAINEEFKILKKLLDNREILKEAEPPVCRGELAGFPVDVCMTSMGMKASLNAAEQVIDAEKYVGVLVLGYCGGLSNGLKVGDSVVASKVRGPLTADYVTADLELCESIGRAHLCEGLNYRNVPLITQPLVIETPEDKKRLFVETHAEAVDMESYEILRTASIRKLQSLAIKVLIDDVETELPHFNDYFLKTGKMDHLSVTQVLVAQPGLSLRLSQNMKVGRVVLEKIIPKIVPVVCRHWNVLPVAPVSEA